jgi:hypothetical protein
MRGSGYINHVQLKEAYRFHPGVCHNLPRVVPKGGITIAGRYFPAGVRTHTNYTHNHRLEYADKPR